MQFSSSVLASFVKALFDNRLHYHMDSHRKPAAVAFLSREEEMDEVNKRCTPANDGEDKHLTRDASLNREQLVKQGAGHLRGSRLSSLFKHFLGGN